MVRFALIADNTTCTENLISYLKLYANAHILETLSHKEDILKLCEQFLAQSGNAKHVGFCVQVDIFGNNGISLTHFIRLLDIENVVIFWRKDLHILSKSDEDKEYSVAHGFNFFNGKGNTSVQKTILKSWILLAKCWPPEARPVYVEFFDLVQEPYRITKQVGIAMSVQIAEENNSITHDGCCCEKCAMAATNCTTNDYLSLPSLMKSVIHVAYGFNGRSIAFAPDSEPPKPFDGWKFRVAEPLMPSNAESNVLEAIRTKDVSSAGSWPRRFSDKLKHMFNVPCAYPCTNGFSAIVLSLLALGVKQGDEVIIPSFTMVAVANAVVFAGAKPVFVDNEENEYNPSINEILQAGSNNTKAVVICHTYAVVCKSIMDIAQLCRARNWALIEDISECVGVEVEMNGCRHLLGTFGDFACASMYVNKMIHACDGGFILAKDKCQQRNIASLANSRFFGVLHFVHTEPAINAKINGLGAAVACACIEQIGHVMEHRRRLSNIYRNRLKSTPLELIPVCGAKDTPWVFGCVCENMLARTAIRHYLAEKGIETRDYFLPLHLQPAYSKINPQVVLRHSEHLGSRGFYLPTHSNLADDQIEYIASCIVDFYKNRT